MSRPTDWDPLCGSDPVPGDPGEVASAASRYANAAREISDQVSTLRRLALNDWVGKAAGRFRDQASSCADDLAKTERRYQAVGSALTTWSHQLADHQADSVRVWNQLQDVNRQLASASQPVASPANPTKAQQQQITADQKAQQKAVDGLNGQLDDLRRQLDGIIGARDGDAHAAASKISDASHHDGLKDSFWDKVKAFVASISRVLSDIANVLGWVATILVVIALFVPGLDVLVAAGLLLAGALLIHSTLAATGNGSWWNVGFDAVSLLTLGVGGAAAKSAEAVEEGLTEGVGGAAFQATKRQLADAGRSELQAQSRITSGVTKATDVQRLEARTAQSLVAKTNVRTAIRSAEQAKSLVANAGVSTRTLVTTMDRELAQSQAVVNALKSSRFADIPSIAKGLDHYSQMARLPKTLLTVNVGEDVTRHVNEVTSRLFDYHFLPGSD